MEKRLKRFLSLAMAILMVVTLLPTNSVFAEGDAAEVGSEPTVCTGLADCLAETHEETCQKKQAEDAANQQSDPTKPVCDGSEECAAETHNDECPKAVCPGCSKLKTACICCPDCDGTKENHSEGCIQLCAKMEGCSEGKHDAQCPLYRCDVCGANPCTCEEPKAACDGTAECPAETHAENCRKKLAEDEVAQIDATPTLDSIAVTTLPTKTGYACGEELDVTGGKLTLTYDDNTTAEAAMTAAMVTGYNATTPGEQTLTVTYEGKTATFTVKVKEALTLYSYGRTHSEFRTDQGIQANSFTTDAAGQKSVSAENLKTSGVAIINTFESGEKWVNATGSGEGFVIYETDNAIYTHTLTVYCPLYMRTQDGQWKLSHSMNAGDTLEGVSFATEASDTGTVPISSLTATAGVLSLANPNTETQTANLMAAGAGTGYIVYTNNGETYKHEVTVSGSSGGGSGNSGGSTAPTEPDIIDENEPHLFLKPAEQDGHLHEAELQLGMGMSCYIFFRNEAGEDVQLDFNALTFTGVVKKSTNSGIEATTVGTGTIAYTVGETTYTLPVSAALPKYGLYLAPTRSVDTFTTSFSGTAGNEKTVFLLWDSKATPAASVTMSVGGSPYTDFTCEVGAGNLKITYTIPAAEEITFNVFDASGAQRYACSLQRNDAGGGKPDYLPETIVKVNYDGKIVTVGCGMPTNGVIMLKEMGGFRFTHRSDAGITANFCLSAFVDYGDQAKETPAPQQFYDAIKDTVTFEFTSWENWTDDETYVPTVTFFDENIGGINTKAAQMFIEPLKLGNGVLAMHFTYDGVRYTTYRTIQYDNPDITLEIGENEDLNAILAHGGEHFLAWLNANHPNEAARYDGVGFIKLNLPAKTYTDVITVDLSFSNPNVQFNSIQLIGNAEGTQMAGLVVKERLFYITNIHFVGNGSGDAINYAPTERGIADVLGSISNCTFRGYHRAIADEGYGHIREVINCKINNCDVGIHMDSKKPSGNVSAGNILYKETYFVKCGTAVLISGLPGIISAFRTRISDCTFLFNTTDFDLENLDLGNNNGDKAKFYFERNYFGKNENGGNENAMRGPAKIKVKNSKIKVITNPVRKTIALGNEYWIYGGENQHSAIFNSDADSMLVDGASFNTTGTNARTTDSSTEIPISIVDDNGNEIAQWTF